MLDSYYQKLSPAGKKAYNWLSRQLIKDKDGDVLVEDMALDTGLSWDECYKWIEQFVRDDKLESKVA